jgi:hypothetical protein
MTASHADELQLFECFIERTQADLPEDYLRGAQGAVIAGPDLIRGLDQFSQSKYSAGWIPSNVEGQFQREIPDCNSCLQVRKLGEFWNIQRIIIGQENREEFQALVFAFGYNPIVTRTHEEAIRLAEHCHPVARAPMAGCWVEICR